MTVKESVYRNHLSLWSIADIVIGAHLPVTTLKIWNGSFPQKCTTPTGPVVREEFRHSRLR